MRERSRREIGWWPGNRPSGGLRLFAGLASLALTLLGEAPSRTSTLFFAGMRLLNGAAEFLPPMRARLADRLRLGVLLCASVSCGFRSITAAKTVFGNAVAVGVTR